MKYSDDTFWLIKSLSKHEKRYFNLAAAKYKTEKKQNYLLLFEAMEKQKEYDESRLRRKFEGTLLGKNFAREKIHLFDLLLRTFRQHPSERNAEVRIRDLIRGAEFLFSKTLYSSGHEQLMKARELALKHQKHQLVVEIHEKEGLVMIQLEDKERMKTYIDLHSKQATESAKLITLLQECRINHVYSFAFTKEMGEDFRNPELLKKYEELLARPLYKMDPEKLPFDAAHHIHFLRGVYARFRLNHHEYMENTKLDLDLHKTHPEIAADKTDQHIASISNYCLAQIVLRRFAEALVTLEEMRSVPLNNLSSQQRADSIYFPRKIDICNLLGKFDVIDGMIREIRIFLRDNIGKFSPSKEIGFYWNISHCYFGAGNFKEALRWLNKITNNKQLAALRPDLHHSERIYNIIIHFELENFEIIEHLVRAARRSFEKTNKGFELEKLILLYVEKLCYLSHGKERMKIFSEFQKDYLLLRKKTPKREDAFYFDFDAWFESKINVISFGDAVRRQNRSVVS